MGFNGLLSLPFEASIESLGEAFWDPVQAVDFPQTRLRFRNDALLQQLGVAPKTIADHDFEQAFGGFQCRQPLLALRYHGYQFGTYNPQLGDGRGFLYGQLRDIHGDLQDLGTKGSGTTPWSRGGDGRLTLKGGVREVIASEALHRLGVTTSRTLSLIETGEELWRGDEPSPTRSAVMVRMARTHLRFGTCERLLYFRDRKGLERLLRHVVAVYYPMLSATLPAAAGDQAALERQLLAFYGELVKRVARLAAEWMAAGFVHGVLNTDNMSLVGESFDYGPFAFLEAWDPGFTAAYFDHTGLYAYGRQPAICHHNLRLLQDPLAMLLPRERMEQALEAFPQIYQTHYRHCLLRRLGLDSDVLSQTAHADDCLDLVAATLDLLASWPVGYGDLFTGLQTWVRRQGLPQEPDGLGPCVPGVDAPPRQAWLAWRDAWWHAVQIQLKVNDGHRAVVQRLDRFNLVRTPTRSLIETLWEEIDQRDDWEPLLAWLAEVRLPT